MGKVLHASKSGYFPFCIKERTTENVGPGTRYPIGLSLEDAMRAYWLIDALTIESSTFSYVTPINFHMGEASAFDFVISQQVYFREKFASEESHVCYPREVSPPFDYLGTTSFFCDSFDYISIPPYLYTIQWAVSIGPQNPGEAAIIKDGDLYYHNIIASPAIVLIDKPEGDPSDYSFLATTNIQEQTPGSYVQSSGNFNFFGLGTTPLYKRTGTFQFGDANFSVVPQSYWSYGGTWNTETGELL